MIGGIPIITAIAGDDATRTAMAQAWCGNGVFAVVVARLRREQALAVAEPGAIFAVWERPAILYQAQGLTRFGRQIFDPYLGACA